MLIDTPPPKHDHRGLVYDDDQLTVFCPGCGFLWRARAWIDDNGYTRVEPYRPVGMIRPDGSEPFFAPAEKPSKRSGSRGAQRQARASRGRTAAI